MEELYFNILQDFFYYKELNLKKSRIFGCYPLLTKRVHIIIKLLIIIEFACFALVLTIKRYLKTPANRASICICTRLVRIIRV